MTTSIAFPNTALPDIVELRDVSQSYDGKVKVLENVNFLIEDQPNQGQFDVLLGPSGCGKSTLLRYIAGLQEPTTGQVIIKGQARKESDTVGMVFQQYSSMPFYTVLQNVMLGLDFRKVPRKEARDRALQMIELVGLKGHENKFAKYPTLSGGQLQRVAIARSLVCNPEILLMDEPFGALDTNTRFKLQLQLTEITSKLESTVLFVTHDIPEAVFLGHRVFVMQANPGRIMYQMHVDLPFPRTRETKRSSKFLAYVNQLEDQMIAMDAISSSTR